MVGIGSVAAEELKEQVKPSSLNIASGYKGNKNLFLEEIAISKCILEEVRFCYRVRITFAKVFIYHIM